MGNHYREVRVLDVAKACERKSALAGLSTRPMIVDGQLRHRRQHLYCSRIDNYQNRRPLFLGATSTDDLSAPQAPNECR